MMVALHDQVGYSGLPMMTVSCKKKRTGSVGAQSSLKDDCLNYINKLRIFPWFHEFLELMTSFKMRTIEVTTTVDKIKELLEGAGHPELIEEFNNFLPPEYKITTSPPPPLQVNLLSRKRKQPESHESDVVPKAIGLVNKVKERFHRGDDDDGDDVYRSFLKIFSDLRCKRNKSSPKSSPQSSNTSVDDELQIYKKVAALFKGQKDLIQDFTQFLTTVPSTYDMIHLLIPNPEMCTPSYIRLPEDFPIPTATGRQDNQSEVLNDRYVSFSVKGSEEKILSNREKKLFKREDDMFLLDLELGRVKSASNRIKDLLEEIETKSLSEICIEGYLSQIDLMCIRRMKDHKRNHKMIDWLMEDAPNALPVILERLDQRKQELEFLFDVETLERVKSVSKRIKVLMEETATNRSPEIRIEGYLSPVDLMCIKRMKDHKQNHRMIDWLMEDAQNALPVILERLEERKQELESSWAPQIKKMLDNPSYVEKLKHQNSLLPRKNETLRTH